uniref:VASP tetramerisation domain-containing protein n=1 Tax=Vombatus ursinus TaxID=29139 RepID=A0A4X2L0X7_VOMUR
MGVGWQRTSSLCLVLSLGAALTPDVSVRYLGLASFVTLKQDILDEMRKELIKLKEELIETFRQELSKSNTSLKK